MKTTLAYVVSALLTVAAGQALADGATPSVDMGQAATADERLAQLRGGMDLGANLHVAFGLERVTSVNGAVIASTRFAIGDVAHVTAAEAQAAQAALGSVLVVRNGQASLTALAPGNQSLGTVIQNSLPDQAIKNLVTLNVSTNSLALLRQQNAADQLRGLVPPGH